MAQKAWFRVTEHLLNVDSYKLWSQCAVRALIEWSICAREPSESAKSRERRLQLADGHGTYH